jgi:hypothetical protein
MKTVSRKGAKVAKKFKDFPVSIAFFAGFARDCFFQVRST